MKLNTIIGFIFSCIVMFSCNKASSDNRTGNDVAAPEIPSFPALSQQAIANLLNSADDLDLQFTDTGFSMNVGGGGAQQTLSSIVPKEVVKSPCKEICLIFVKSKGEQIAHISAHIGEGCSYYVFYENNRPAYVNLMNQQGIEFYNSMLARFKTNPMPGQ